MKWELHGEECTEEVYWKHWDTVGIKECKHHNLPMTCTKCNHLNYRVDDKRLHSSWQAYEYLCRRIFEEKFGIKLPKMNIYSYIFDGGSFENFNILIDYNNILIEYKSAGYDGPSNYSNAEESLIKMIIAEITLMKPILKVMVFRSRTLAERFLKKLKKLEILLSKAGIKPNSVQIWWFNGSDEPEKL